MTEAYLFSGPKHSGKTTALRRWAASRNDVFGFLTPVVEGRRRFYDLGTGESFAMEAEPDEPCFEVGRYRFSVASFRRAEALVLQALEEKQGWIIIDEIGPLELRGEGFHALVQEVLARSTSMKLVFVVRHELREAVCGSFGLEERPFLLPEN